MTSTLSSTLTSTPSTAGTLFAIAWKNALQNRSRLVLTVVAVVLSVAFLTATLIVADSVTGTAAEDVAEANASLSLVVEGEIISEGDGGPGEALESVRANIEKGAIEIVRGVDGVSAVEPVIAGFAKVVAGGSAIGGGTASDVGRNWIPNDLLNPFKLLEGSAPSGSDEIVIDQSLAEAGDIAIGDTVEVLTSTGVRQTSVVGVAGYGNAKAAPLQRTVFFDQDHTAEATAQQGAGQLRVLVSAEAELAQVSADIAAAVRGSEITAGPAFITRQQDAVSSPFAFLSLFLIAFAGVATVAGATIIFNTLTIAIGQRRRELALLRAIGVARRQVVVSVLVETSIVALFATIIGIAVGLLGAGGLRSLMDIAGLSFIDGPTVVRAPTIVIAALVGLVVTIGSAWAPTRTVSSAAPVEALRSSQIEAAAPSQRRVLIGLLTMGAAVTMVVAAALSKAPILLAGLALIVPGLALAGPAFVAGSVKVCKRFLASTNGIKSTKNMGRTKRVEGEIAVTNLDRNRRRAASTSLGLTLGVALVAFFTVIAGSLNASFTSTLENQLNADLVVTSVSTEVSTIEPGLVRRIDSLDTVTAAGLSLVEGSVDGEGAIVGGIDESMPSLFDFVTTKGSIANLTTGGVAIWSGFESADRSIGDSVEIRVPGGVLTLPVVAIFDESLAGFDPPTHLLNSELLDALQPGLLDSVIFVKAESETSQELVRPLVAETPGSLFETRNGYIGAAGAEVDSILNLIYALLALTVLIAIVGVANTTALAITERITEIGLLRSIGVTRRGIRSIIRFEAAVLAALGTLMGLAVGLLGSWALLRAAGESTLNTIAVPWIQLGLVGAASIAMSIAAAALPAWRAARLPTLDAIAA